MVTWSEIASRTNPFTPVTSVGSDDEYTPSHGEHVIVSDGGIVILPEPQQNDIVAISADGPDSDIQIQPETGQIEGSSSLLGTPDDRLILLSDGEDWYAREIDFDPWQVGAFGLRGAGFRGQEGGKINKFEIDTMEAADIDPSDLGEIMGNFASDGTYLYVALATDEEFTPGGKVKKLRPADLSVVDTSPKYSAYPRDVEFDGGLLYTSHQGSVRKIDPTDMSTVDSGDGGGGNEAIATTEQSVFVGSIEFTAGLFKFDKETLSEEEDVDHGIIPSVDVHGDHVYCPDGGGTLLKVSQDDLSIDESIDAGYTRVHIRDGVIYSVDQSDYTIHKISPSDLSVVETGGEDSIPDDIVTTDIQTDTENVYIGTRSHTVMKFSQDGLEFQGEFDKASDAIWVDPDF